MRGHGESIKPPAGAYSLRHTADDAAAFIEALGLDNPALMGHSWGGATAIVLASGAGSHRPIPTISHLILEDPAHDFGSGDVEERAAYYTRDIGRPDEELRLEIAASNPGWTEEDIKGKIDALHNLSREAVVSVFADAGREGELLPLLASITAPTLLIRADSALGTTLNEAAWEQAKRLLPVNSYAVQIDGATHNIHRSKFDAFMQVVNDFLFPGSSSRQQTWGQFWFVMHMLAVSCCVVFSPPIPCSTQKSCRGRRSQARISRRSRQYEVKSPE
jgi:pimeloyl-ACP methyl ester carboxylesterase